MARTSTHPPLNVFMNNRLVGQLRREKSGAIDFQYGESWLAWEHAIPVSLSLQLREDRYIGAPVIAVFDNLLPDNIEIRKRVSAKMQAGGTDAYSLLSAVGRDCVGALQFLPIDTAPNALDDIDGEELNDEQMEAILSDLKAAPLGLGQDQEFRISIAGAQEKTAFTWWNGKWILPHGTTPTTHIFKPQIGELPNGIDLKHSVENEYFCLKLCQNMGLPSAEVEMARFGDKSVLIVERFDRQIDGRRMLRLPQEDMCQALGVPPDAKYQSDGGPKMEDILIFLRGSNAPEIDQANFIKSNILFWLIGATDGHAKNFSIALEPGGRFSMTPLYDVLTAEPSFASGDIPRNKYRLAMSVGTNRHYQMIEIMPRHFVQTAKRADIGQGDVEAIFADVRKHAENALEKTIADLPPGFPSELVEPVAEAFRKRLALTENLD
jgi:serine/threonine-protein kinase HipA